MCRLKKTITHISLFGTFAIAFLISIVSMLTGCGQKHKIRYIKVDEISKEIDGISSLKLSNLELNNTTYNVYTDELGEVEVTETKLFLNKEKEIWCTFIGEDYDENKIFTDPKYIPPGPIYEDEVKKIYATLGVNGFFCFHNEIFQIDILNELPKWSCDLFGNYEVLSPSGIKINELFDKISPMITKAMTFDDMSWQPFRVSLVEDEGNEYYAFEYRKMVNNNPVNILYNHYGTQSNEKNTVASADVVCNAEGQVVFLANSTVLEKGDTEKYEKVVSLTSALKKASELLADRSRYDVKCIEIVYRTMDAKIVEDGLWYTASYTLKPFWAFYISLEYGKEIYIMVDCKTGEVEFVNNAYGWTE